MSFADNLKRIRKEKNLSQEELAEIMNVSRQSISKYEQGQTYPEIDKLIHLSEKFNITIDSLIHDNEANEYNLLNYENTEEFINTGDGTDEEDDEKAEWLMVGGFIVGISIGLVTGNFMWGTAGCFLGLGLGYIFKIFRDK